MKLEQAARQALKALIDSDDGGGLRYTEVQAVAALREALAEQAEQEPVAYLRMGSDQRFVVTKAAEELVADTFHQLYAAPVRTKDLTDDELAKAAGFHELLPQELYIARAVIAADREKNRGTA